MYGALETESPISVTNISAIVSFAAERRIMKSSERNVGRKLKPVAVYTGLFRLASLNICTVVNKDTNRKRQRSLGPWVSYLQAAPGSQEKHQHASTFFVFVLFISF